MNFVRILVPIDFSEASLNAFKLAQERFSGANNTLILLHAIESGLGLIDTQNNIQPSDIEAARHRLSSLGKLQSDAWKEVSTLVEAGKPVDCILSAARHENADLVIMGSHGNGGLKHALFGSTTYDVARKLQCSVMVTKTA